MDKKDFVTYDTARALKSKGYSEYSLYYYNRHTKKLSESSGLLCNEDFYNVVECTAPTLYEAQQWLRDIHNIAVCPKPFNFDWDYYIYDLNNIDKDEWNHIILDAKSDYGSYESALNAGIKESLKLI